MTCLLSWHTVHSGGTIGLSKQTGHWLNLSTTSSLLELACAAVPLLIRTSSWLSTTDVCSAVSRCRTLRSCKETTRLQVRLL